MLRGEWHQREWVCGVSNKYVIMALCHSVRCGGFVNISDVAKKTGLTSKAIRFYEEKGLVTPPLRGENGYRTYGQQHLNELTLLRQARQVGFNLEECGELVNLFNDPGRHSADVKKRTLEKVAEIEHHISELQSMRTQLLALAASCPGDDSAECPIIENLSGCCHHKAQA